MGAGWPPTSRAARIRSSIVSAARSTSGPRPSIRRFLRSSATVSRARYAPPGWTTRSTRTRARGTVLPCSGTLPTTTTRRSAIGRGCSRSCRRRYTSRLPFPSTRTPVRHSHSRRPDMKYAVTVLLGLMFVVADGGVFAQAPQGAPAAGQGRGDTQGQAQGRQGGGRGRGPAAPAGSSLACDVARDGTRTAALLTTMVDAMPADKFGFKPTDAQQTFAERVVHIAQTDLRLLGSLGAKTPPPT